MPPTPDMPSTVHQVFETFSPLNHKVLLEVRGLIFEVAAADPAIGPLEESLRWGEPAYLTPRSKSGSTIRLGVDRVSGKPALFFNCNTTLVEEFRQQFENRLTYSKNRAVLLDATSPLPSDAVRMCIAAALTYHLRRK